MPITSVTKDADALTMTVVADFDAPLRRLWDAYLDPRLLERFWGPPTYPAVFTRHDGYVGGRSEYAMTGPDGDVARGFWEWLSVDELAGFEVRDGFANPDGSPNEQMPAMRMVFTFEATPHGSRVTTTTFFASVEELETLLGMGMEQGMSEAMGQIDAVLADLASFAAGIGTATQLLSDTQVRISRIIRGSVDDVWRAHHEPALMRRWLLGPEGWTMPVCEIGAEVGETYRYEWEQVDGSGRFGFTGTVLESRPPHRSVTTGVMIGTDGPSTTDELTFTAVEDGTLLSLLITYPDADVRDTVLATGMTDGMETSYARLESLIG
ncbi:SRPBCC family protein [Cellulomonas sp. P24]|uniref:SRPBCC family protein n=1 Tax=Cellulomonas sp. P24 TaxID=2885206 RepID=UPI00216B5229|nr:SRPBCC family protein [Cellulomonas sp. P24]MCR6493798.1 SRPBCC domain-containing protein [Cellulomonas sp. P24]